MWRGGSVTARMWDGSWSNMNYDALQAPPARRPSPHPHPSLGRPAAWWVAFVPNARRQPCRLLLLHVHACIMRPSPGRAGVASSDCGTRGPLPVRSRQAGSCAGPVPPSSCPCVCCTMHTAGHGLRVGHQQHLPGVVVCVVRLRGRQRHQHAAMAHCARTQPPCFAGHLPERAAWHADTCALAHA